MINIIFSQLEFIPNNVHLLTSSLPEILIFAGLEFVEKNVQNRRKG